MFAKLKQVLSVAAKSVAMAAVALLIITAPSQAEEKKAQAGYPSWGPQFTLPKSDNKCVHDPDFAKTGKCVRDTAFMRRNHMELLKHKRDRTMREGIRTKDSSLQNCINCHVTKDKAGEAIKVSNPKHFCASCHLFVAVKLDCFECHRSTPETPKGSASIPKIPEHSGLLAANTIEAKNLKNFLSKSTKEGVSQ